MKTLFCLGFAVAFSVPAHAQTSSSTSSQSPGATRVKKSVAELKSRKAAPAYSKWGFSYAAFLYGPPVSEMNSDETPAARDGYTIGLSVQNQLGVRYFLSKDLYLSPVFDFEYQFTDPHKDNTAGASLVYDSFVKLKYVDALSGRVEGNRFSLDLEGRYYVPVSEFSRANSSLGSIRLAAIPGVDVGKTGLQLSMLAFYRYWMQTKYYQVSTTFSRVPKNTIGLPEHTFYIGPQINYHLSRTFNLWLLYERSHTIDTLGYATDSDPRRSTADIEPGIDIRLMNGVYVTPYLNWYTNQPIETTSINLITSITI